MNCNKFFSWLLLVAEKLSRIRYANGLFVPNFVFDKVDFILSGWSRNRVSVSQHPKRI